MKKVAGFSKVFEERGHTDFADIEFSDRICLPESVALLVKKLTGILRTVSNDHWRNMIVQQLSLFISDALLCVSLNILQETICSLSVPLRVVHVSEPVLIGDTYE